VLFVGSLCALIASLVAFLSHLTEFYKYYVRTMFIGGFLMSSTVVFFFAVSNRNNDIVCTDNNTAYIQQGPICVFQACASVFVFTWIELWSLILSFDSYLMVHNRQISLYASTPQQHAQQKMKLYKIYTVVAVVLCTVLTIIPLLAGNYGFDPEANVPICLFLFSTDSTYFWAVFYIPFTILVLGCIYFSVLGICQIQSIFVNSPKYFLTETDSARSSNFSAQNASWNYASDKNYGNDTDINNHLNQTALEGIEESGHSASNLSKLMTARDSLCGYDAYDDNDDMDYSAGDANSIRESVDLEATVIQTSLLRNSHLSSGSASGVSTGSGNGGIRLGNSFIQNDRYDSAAGNGNVSGSSETAKGMRSQNSVESFFDEDQDEGGAEPETRLSVANVFLLSPNTSANTSTNNSSQVGDILTTLQMQSGENSAQNSYRKGGGNVGITERNQGGPLDDSFMVGIGDDENDGVNAGAYNRSQLTSVMSIGSHSQGTTNTRSGNTESAGTAEVQRISDGSKGTVDEEDMYDVSSFNPIASSHYPGDDTYQHKLNKMRMRSDSRGRTESSQSNETISLGTDIGSNEGDYRLNSTSSMGVAAVGGSTKRSSSTKRKLKRSLIKSTRDRILHMLVNNETIAQTLKYNGRAIIFVIIFCLTTLYIIPLLADLQYFQYKRYQDGTAEFITCLMTTSAQSKLVVPPIPQNVVDVSNYVNDICGDIPQVRPPLGAIISAICWYAAYGIIPALVFGAGSYMVDCCCINDGSLSVNPDSVPQSPVRGRTRTSSYNAVSDLRQSNTSKR